MPANVPMSVLGKFETGLILSVVLFEERRQIDERQSRRRAGFSGDAVYREGESISGVFAAVNRVTRSIHEQYEVCLRKALEAYQLIEHVLRDLAHSQLFAREAGGIDIGLEASTVFRHWPKEPPQLLTAHLQTVEKEAKSPRMDAYPALEAGLMIGSG